MAFVKSRRVWATPILGRTRPKRCRILQPCGGCRDLKSDTIPVRSGKTARRSPRFRSPAVVNPGAEGRAERRMSIHKNIDNIPISCFPAATRLPPTGGPSADRVEGFGRTRRRPRRWPGFAIAPGSAARRRVSRRGLGLFRPDPQTWGTSRQRTTRPLRGGYGAVGHDQPAARGRRLPRGGDGPWRRAAISRVADAVEDAVT